MVDHSFGLATASSYIWSFHLTLSLLMAALRGHDIIYNYIEFVAMW